MPDPNLPRSAHSSFARHATPARTLPAAVTRFIRTESAGGIALVGAAVVAMVWANSPWSHVYDDFWHTPLALQVGPLHLDQDLRHFVNDGLMALFFFLVGLEIKREATQGELTDRRVAALPAFAALGGMVVPALIYVAIARGNGIANGWGIPMATDIAFALGVLALLGSRVPTHLKLFLLTLAIVDDIGAILVIAVFYSEQIAAGPLMLAVAGVALTALLRRARVDWPPAYILIGLATWYATYKSGVHATIAGVALALTTPARPLAPTETVQRWAQDLSDEPTAEEVRQMTIIARESVSPTEHLEELLHSTTSFFVLPVFALANAGVSLRSDMLGGDGATNVAVGVFVALVVGKFVGVLIGARIGLAFGAALPIGVRWIHLAGAGALAGIGFTVSLFVAGLAFDDAHATDAARLGILVASVTAACLGAGILAASGARKAT